MTLKDMVDIIMRPSRVEIRNSDNREICVCATDSLGVEPYLDKKVTRWFPGNPPGVNVNFVVLLEI